MARRSQLEGRVVAVLDAARARGRVPGRVAVLAGGVAAVALFPLAAASPDARSGASAPRARRRGAGGVADGAAAAAGVLVDAAPAGARRAP